MADEVKKVIIEVKAETKQATASIRKLTAQVKTLEHQQVRSNKTMRKSTTAINKVAGSFKTLSAHLARLVVIYGSFEALTSTITVFADFEQSIKTLGAVSGASGEELDALKAKALELGKSTVFTASQVVGGMTEMARAGLSAQQQLDGISAVLNLSITGLVDLSEATKIAVTTMHGFGLQAKDMGMISDVLTASINSSSQNLDELSSALAKVAPVAHAQNVSLQETVSVLGSMANAGIRAELAGTQLKIILTRLGANNQTNKYMKELGLSMYDLRTKQLLPLMDRLKLLKNALNNLSPDKKNTYIAEIFGTRSIATANVLLGKIKQIELQTKFLKNSFGVADTQARKMMDTLLGSWKELKSALENLEILIGGDMSDSLKALVQDATDFIRELSPKDIKAFGDAMGTVITTAYDFGKILANVVMVGVKFGEMLSPNGKISGGMIFLGALIYKLRVRLIELLSTQPEILALIISLGVLLQAMMGADAELKSMVDNTETYKKALEKNNNVLIEAEKLYKKHGHSLTSLRKIVSLYGDSIDYSKRQLKAMGVEIVRLEKKKKDSWWSFNALDAQKLKQFRLQYKLLNDNITSEMGVRNIASKEAQKILDKENEARDKNNKLTATATKLTEKEIKTIEKEITSYENRQKTAQTALDSMIIKETQYYNKITSLEAKLSKTRVDYANKRATLNANFENDIANIQSSSLSNLQQYNDAQLRADKVLASAKRALTQGNITLAKNYMSIYNSLITQQTSSEIASKHKIRVYNATTHKYETKEVKDVQKTKLQLNNELIADKKRGHQIELGILKEEEDKAIKIINNQIDLEKNKIKLNKVQMDIQLQILEIQTKIVGKLKGGLASGFTDDITNARKEMEKLSAEALKLTDKQRTIKINAVVNKNNLAKDVDSVGKDTTISPKTKVDTTSIKNKVEEVKPEITITYKDYGVEEFEKKFGKAKKEAEKPIYSNYDVATEKSENKITILQQKSKKPTKSLHTIQVNDTAVLRAKTINSKNTSSIHTIYEVTVPKHATGGFIQRSGSLGGYGGGDKVKALLEQGEFIVRKEAVKSLGINRLQTINQGIIPKFATGGLVGIGTPQKLLEKLSSTTSNSSNNASSSNWDSLISLLRDLLSSGGLPSNFKNIFKDMLKSVEENKKTFTSREDVVNKKIIGINNNTFGKVLTPGQAKINARQKTLYQNNLDIISKDGQTKLSDFNDKLAIDKGKLADYITKIISIKEQITPLLTDLNIKPPIALKDSMDLNKITTYFNQLNKYKNNADKLKKETIANIQQTKDYYGSGISEITKDSVMRYYDNTYSGYKTNNMFGVDINKYIKHIMSNYTLPKFKTGGLLSGYGGGDKNLSLLENGEFVIRKEAVKNFGSGLFEKLNNLSLPKFQTGGFVGTMQTQQNLNDVNLNFTMPSGNTYQTVSSSEVAKALGNELRKLQ